MKNRIDLVDTIQYGPKRVSLEMVGRMNGKRTLRNERNKAETRTYIASSLETFKFAVIFLLSQYSIHRPSAGQRLGNSSIETEAGLLTKGNEETRPETRMRCRDLLSRSIE